MQLSSCKSTLGKLVWEAYLNKIPCYKSMWACPAGIAPLSLCLLSVEFSGLQTSKFVLVFFSPSRTSASM